MQKRPRRNPQAWGRKLRELREAVGKQRGTKLSLGELSKELSLLGGRLTDREIEGLESFGAVAYLNLGVETLSRYESGDRSPDLRAIFFMIYYFKKQRVIDLEGADQWLAMAGEEPLYEEESRFLFGNIAEIEESLPAKEEIISIRKQQGAHTFIIPNEYIPEHNGYAVFKGTQGLIIKLLTIILLIIGLAAALMYTQVIVARLIFDPATPTPPIINLTPIPVVTPAPLPTTTDTPQAAPQLPTSPLPTPTLAITMQPSLAVPKFPPPAIIKPQDGLVFSADLKEINFQWEDNFDSPADYGGKEYELYVENIDYGIDNPKLKQDYRNLKKPSFNLPIFHPGLYRWRLRAVFVFDNAKLKEWAALYDEQEVPSEWGDWHTFRIGQ